MRRGEIWWAVLPKRAGYRRPVLIVQSDSFTGSEIGTVVVAVITSNIRLAVAPGNVELTKTQSGLARPSVVNVSQLITMDKAMLTERVHELERTQLAEVDQGLRIVLGLSGTSPIDTAESAHRLAALPWRRPTG